MKVIRGFLSVLVRARSQLGTRFIKARRTIADQEVLALIAPLAKLGRFEAAAKFFEAYALQLAYRVGRYKPIPPG